MARGIILLGLNGCGKTTLGRLLAACLGWQRLDTEDYFFLDSEIPFAASRTAGEVRALLEADIRAKGDFVLSSVHGEWGGEIVSQYVLAVLLSAPKEVRLARIRARGRARFGARVLPGGDMYAREQDFYAFAAKRDPTETERRAAALPCPLLRLDAAQPPEALAEAVLRRLAEIPEEG